MNHLDFYRVFAGFLLGAGLFGIVRTLVKTIDWEDQSPRAIRLACYIGFVLIAIANLLIVIGLKEAAVSDHAMWIALAIIAAVILLPYAVAVFRALRTSMITLLDSLTVGDAVQMLERGPLRFGDEQQIYAVKLLSLREQAIGVEAPPYICPECEGAGECECGNECRMCYGSGFIEARDFDRARAGDLRKLIEAAA